MSTHNIQFPDKKKKFSRTICSLELSEGIKNEFELGMVKRAIGVRAIEVRMYENTDTQRTSTESRIGTVSRNNTGEKGRGT